MARFLDARRFRSSFCERANRQLGAGRQTRIDAVLQEAVAQGRV